MNTIDYLTELLTLAGLRQQAQRLGIKGFSRMRKRQLLAQINQRLERKIER